MVFRHLSTKPTGCRQILSTALYFVINLSITVVESRMWIKKLRTIPVDKVIVDIFYHRGYTAVVGYKLYGLTMKFLES